MLRFALRVSIAWLMRSAMAAIIADEVVPEFTADGFGCDGPLPNVDFYGNDLFHMPGDSNTCKETCKDTRACGAFTVAHGVCYVKADVSANVVSKRGCNSYICYRQAP
ncbi:hypothetical protein DYB32_003102 [Aphanomyces invadans]|uniref:Apple domain-containing protein n=1 Tax=Aphanomyces invadans TaxID=157072 RepID=A0A3R6Z6W2_9STRA|nr:hypothetical protein DYB32_003102 [Aphanomyces invadans]